MEIFAIYLNQENCLMIETKNLSLSIWIQTNLFVRTKPTFFFDNCFCDNTITNKLNLHLRITKLHYILFKKYNYQFAVGTVANIILVFYRH